MKSKLFIFLGVLWLYSLRVLAYEDLTNVVVEKENTPDISMGILDTRYGNIAVRKQAKVFGCRFDNDSGVSLSCDFRFAAFDETGSIKQIYDGDGYVTLNAGGSVSIKHPCLIDLPEGDYYFVPIVRIAGDSKWYLLTWWQIIVSNGYWKLHVYETYNAPASNYMNLPDASGKGDSEYSVYHSNIDEKFRVEANLINVNPFPLSGKVKVMWERNLRDYWRGHSYDDTDIKTEWSMCASNLSYCGESMAINGGIPITIPANSELHMLIEDCFLPSYFDYGDRWCPYLALYFLPEGKSDTEENWLQINENANFSYNSDGTLKTDYLWDHALNVLAYEVINNQTQVETIDLEAIDFVYNKSTNIVSLSGIPDSAFVRAYSIEGRLLTSSCHVVNGVSSFSISNNNKIIIIVLFDSDGTQKKSFKILL